MRVVKALLISSVTAALSACIALPEDNDFDAKVKQANEQIQQIQSSKDYAVIDGPRVVFEAVHVDDGPKNVFDTKRVNISQLGGGTTLEAVIEMFQKKGLNVIAQGDVALNTPILTYAIKDASARQALELITYDLGMGYQLIDDKQGEPYAVITGLPTLEYRLNVPNEERVLSQFVVNKTREEQDNGLGSGSSQGGSSQGSQSSSGSTGSDQGGDVNQLTSLSEVKTAFWDDLEKYISSALNEIVRTPDLGPMVQRQFVGEDSGMPQTTGIYRTEARAVGTVSINRTTGHLSIAAPRHKLDRIKKYLRELDLLMNSKIVLKGKVVAYTSTEREQRGIDVAALAPYCTGEFRCIVSNSQFNNVTITEPGVNNWFDAAADNLTGTSLLGLQSLDQTWQVFNAYTQDNSNIRIVDTFEGSVTHGVPATFSETINNVNQLLSSQPTATSDGVTTGGGTRNELIPYRTGTVITIVPSLDLKNGSVSNVVDVKLSLRGAQTQIRQVTDGGIENGTYQNVNNIEFQVQPTQKSGELVIVAGKTSSSLSDSDNGTTGLKDSYVGGIFGSSQRIKETTTYYILLQTKVIPANIGK